MPPIDKTLESSRTLLSSLSSFASDRSQDMAQQAYEFLSQTSTRPQMPRRRRSSASTAGDATGLQQLSTLSLSSSPLSSSSDSSAPPSLIFSSTSPSPSSSLSSSPSLGPTKRFSHSAAVPDPLSLGAPLQPNSVELAKYASDIIRNEAYALLALAARLAPAAYPLLDDDGAHVVRATDSSSSAGTDSSDDGCEDSDDAAYAKSPVGVESHVEESRTNQAFRNVVTLIQSMPRHGKILISGIGKSGIVARKMVATFCSLGASARRSIVQPAQTLES